MLTDILTDRSPAEVQQRFSRAAGQTRQLLPQSETFEGQQIVAFNISRAAGQTRQLLPQSETILRTTICRL